MKCFARSVRGADGEPRVLMIIGTTWRQIDMDTAREFTESMLDAMSRSSLGDYDQDWYKNGD